MRVTIECDNELDYALQLHLETGVGIQIIVKAALRFFRDLHKVETQGKHLIGFGDISRFKQWNTEVSPQKYIDSSLYTENIK